MGASGRLNALSRGQRVILAIGLVVAAAGTIYAPWTHTFATPGMAVARTPAGRSFILDPPPPRDTRVTYGVELDTVILLTQTGVIAAVTAALIVLLPARVVRTDEHAAPVSESKAP